MAADCIEEVSQDLIIDFESIAPPPLAHNE